MWSTSGFFAKAPWFDGWDPQARGVLLAFFRSLFAVIVLVPMIRRPRFRPAMLLMTVCFAGMVWSFMEAMVHGPAANAIWLQYLCPAWVALGGSVVLRERVGVRDRRMLAFCLSGVLFILVMEFRGGSGLYASFMGILSGVTFAGVLLSMRELRDEDAAWLITLNHGATVLMLMPWAWAAHEPIAAGSYAALGLFGVFQMSVPYVLFARGLRSVAGAEASMLSLIEPLLVPLWVFVAWHDHASYQAPPWWTWVGGGMILCGLLQRYLPHALRRSTRGNTPV